MISVVIPALNAQDCLPHCFDSLIAATVRGLVKEVIVADGGSSDDTLMIADAAGAHVVSAGRDRAAQLAAGAAIARGDWLLFLHPETALENGWENEVESLMSRSTLERPRAATFRFAIDDFEPSARRREALAAWRWRLFGLAHGDQGLVIPRRFYQKLGGYRSVAMEDADLVRRIGRGRLLMLRSRAINKAAPPRGRWTMILTILHALRVPRSVVARLG
jgi:glycosyltransferase involved in cell wall biosynthesis